MSIITCPHCGVTDEARYSFCSHCGKLFPTEALSGEEGVDSKRERQPKEYHESFGWLSEEEADQDPTVQKSAAENPKKKVPEEGTHGRDDQSRINQAHIAHELPGLLKPFSFESLFSAGEPDHPDLDVDATEEHKVILQRIGRGAGPTNDDELRRIRRLMMGEPTIAEEHIHNDSGFGKQGDSALNIPWLFWLLGLMVGIPLFLQLSFPSGEAQELPGVADAFETVNTLADGAEVLLLWAYDPATSGEMDLVAEPVLYHLLQQRNSLSIVSLLPTGPASAQQLLQKLSTDTDIGLIDPLVVNYGFLPGGSTILPLLGQDLATALKNATFKNDLSESSRSTAALPTRNPQTFDPELIVVVAAEAEDVQHWIEFAQPLNKIPVIAVVAAGADLLLRPYVDSRQLSGIVSGFDGGGAYQALLDRTEDLPVSASTLPAAVRQHQQIILQNWGHLAFILLIFLGNFALLINRDRDELGGAPALPTVSAAPQDSPEEHPCG